MYYEDFVLVESADTLCMDGIYSECPKNFFEQALELDPEHKITNYNMGIVEYYDGDKKIAFDYFSKASSIGYSDHYKGIILREKNDLRYKNSFTEGHERGCCRCTKELIMIKCQEKDFFTVKQLCDELSKESLEEDRKLLIQMGVTMIKSPDYEKFGLECLEKAKDYYGIYLYYKQKGDIKEDYLSLAVKNCDKNSYYDWGEILIQRKDISRGISFIYKSKTPESKQRLIDIFDYKIAKKEIDIDLVELMKKYLDHENYVRMMSAVEVYNLTLDYPNPHIVKECAELDFQTSKFLFLKEKIYSPVGYKDMSFYFNEMKKLTDVMTEAKLELAKMYLVGKGTAVSQINSLQCYNEAALEGSREAQYYMSSYLKNLSDPRMDQLEESRLWILRCLQPRENEEETPNKEKYLRQLRVLEEMIENKKPNEEEKFINRCKVIYKKYIDGDSEAKIAIQMLDNFCDQELSSESDDDIDLDHLI